MEPINLEKWLDENKDAFAPPVCNKMMYNEGQLKVMYVAGVNQRKDYHIEEGEEIFYMHKGDMNLPIFEHGKPVTIEIKEGEWFLLPARIPHSPQRPEKASRGLVIERLRLKTELDALRYYTEDQSQILWEEWFYCYDLGKQLKPVIQEYFASPQHKTGKPIPGDHINPSPPFAIEQKIDVPRPIKFSDWFAQHGSTLDNHGKVLVGFPGCETQVLVFGHGLTASQTVPVEALLPLSSHIADAKPKPYWTLLWQYKGSATLTLNGKVVSLKEGDHFLVPVDTPFSVERSAGSVGIQIQMFPHSKPQ